MFSSDTPIGGKDSFGEVWTQGGFEAEYGTLDAFLRACDQDPTKLHRFLEIRASVIKLKIQDPHLTFRVVVYVGPKESIQLETTTESGLEQPEVFWVELDEYIKTYGEPDQADIVQEIVKGVTKLGAN